MINKIHFGKRIASLRKSKKLSQSELAHKLGVTPQAVSKWECGAALPDIALLLEISHLYNVSVNTLLEDKDLLLELTGHSTDKHGIACFLPEKYISAENEMNHGKQVAKNWERAMTQNGFMDDIGKRIASQHGIILETDAGPEGGFMPYILKSNPDACVIISDHSPAVVREWKSFLDQKLDSPNLHYAVLDSCSMPFRSNSLDIISDGGGFRNAEGDKAGSLKEAYRVLKPGGLLVTSTGFVNKETRAGLPKEVQDVLLKKRPDIFEDLYEETVLAGFKKIDSVISGCRYTAEDDSSIALLAHSLGINLKFTSYIRFCSK